MLVSLNLSHQSAWKVHNTLGEIMSLEELEVNVGGTKFKGIYLAILLSFGSTLGGGIWAASEFFSRLEMMEENVEESLNNSELVNTRFEDFRDSFDEDKKSMMADIEVAKSQIESAGVDQLQGKLAELGTNLQTIMQRQTELLTLAEDMTELEKSVNDMNNTVQRAEMITAESQKLQSLINRHEQEIEKLWEGLDFLSNPYGN